MWKTTVCRIGIQKRRQYSFPILNKYIPATGESALLFPPLFLNEKRNGFFALAFPMTFLLAPKTFFGPRLFNKLPLAAPTISQWQWKSHNSGAEKRGKTRKKAGSQASRRTRSRKAGKQDESDAEFCF